MATNNVMAGLMDIIKEEGVRDLLPMKCKANFGRALLYEKAGDNEQAEFFLDEAIKEETKFLGEEANS